MADRYWVGGTGSWFDPTKWATSSGGSGGASVPTSVDNVFFDANSGSGVAHYTVTVTTSATCLNLTFTPVSTSGVTVFDVENGFNVVGTFSTSGTQGNRRLWLRSSVYGLMRDITVAVVGAIADVDFRGIRVVSPTSPISGTRLGNLSSNVNITFSPPKTVYWNQAAGGNWSDNAWAASSGGGVSTDNFPLAQDTAVIENTGLNASATVTLDSAIPYIGTVSMSTRTNAMTLAGSTGYTVYGDWVLGSGVTQSYSGTLTFSGRNTQTITSAGRVMFGAITVDSYGGTVQLADALNIGSNALTVTNGTFDTKNYNVVAGQLSSSNSNVRTITLGSSTVTLSGSVNPIVFTTSTNLTFNAGTSSISTQTGLATIAGGGQIFYNVSFTNTTSTTYTITGANTFNTLTLPAPASAGLIQLALAANQTITGTLTIAGATAVRRIFVRSDTLGTTRTLTVGTISVANCDFRDITIAGAAAGASPIRAGDCGGNSGITFPAPKTVYWNLAGTQNWSATAWASSSGGAPNINNFPLAQDTAVFDNAGSVTGTITIEAAWNIGTFDSSARSAGMTLLTGASPAVHGNWTFGSAVSMSSSFNTINFAGRGVQVINSNGRTFGCSITVACVSGTVQLASSLLFTTAITIGLTLVRGTFDAVSYNVTAGFVTATGGSLAVLKMGSGLWSLTGNSLVWDLNNAPEFYKGSANISITNTSSNITRYFYGGSLCYNGLTIGGGGAPNTVFVVAGYNSFSSFSSTKTVGQTIDFSGFGQTFGSWSVSGTASYPVYLYGSSATPSTQHFLAGPDCVANYLYLGSFALNDTSPGALYVPTPMGSSYFSGPIYLSSLPAARTLYWVGGSGSWGNGSRWSLSSGGPSAFVVPTSSDNVIFNSASSAGSYTVTIDFYGARCNQLTASSPALGTVSFQSTFPYVLSAHGSVTLSGSVTFSPAITLSGTGVGKTLTTNGIPIANTNRDITVNGIGSEWSLGSALTVNNFPNFILLGGSFRCGIYNFTVARFYGYDFNSFLRSSTRSIDFGSSNTSITLGSFYLLSSVSAVYNRELSVISGTSQITLLSSGAIYSDNFSFYNVTFSSIGFSAIYGSSAFNNLSFVGRAFSGSTLVALIGTQTIAGALTVSAGASASARTIFASDSFGTTATINCSTFSLVDVDFRWIRVSGAIAYGVRLGNLGYSSGIQFANPKTVYWSQPAGGNWFDVAWSSTAGGTPNADNYPLAQDTVIFEAAGLDSGATVAITSDIYVGTIDMSPRTSRTMTLNIASNITVHGDFINGTGTTLSGTPYFLFFNSNSNRTQKIRSVGVSFPSYLSITAPVELQDSFTAQTLFVSSVSGSSFNLNGYTATFVNASGSNIYGGLVFASGSLVLAASGSAWYTSSPSALSITGPGTISLTSSSPKTFVGSDYAYPDITLNQAGSGSLTITGNNTFGAITNTYKSIGATSINLGSTVQRITNSWGASGEAGRYLLVLGSPASIIYTGSGTATNASVGYLSILGVRAYSLSSTWYPGEGSSNSGSLGWVFGSSFNSSYADSATAVDASVGYLTFPSTVDESVRGSDSSVGYVAFPVSVAELAQGSDIVSATPVYAAFLLEQATGADQTLVASSTFNATVPESAQTVDVFGANASFPATIAEQIAATDTLASSYLWVLIDDSQNANWQNINTTQAPGWANTPTDANPSWVNVDTN